MPGALRSIFKVSHVRGCLFKAQVRRLSLLEYHSHKLLKDFDIPVPRGFVVETPEEAREVVAKINAPSVVKAQVLAGGRGKGKYESDGQGGVRIMSSGIEAFENASRMIGYYLETKQTPPGGLLVKKLYIYKAVDIAQEYYVALTFDRDRSMPVLLISNVGGVDIESNADRLEHYWFDMTHGITDEIVAYIQAQLGFSDQEMGVISHILRQMVKLFREKDATLLELNPLVRTCEGQFVCLDAKFTFDNSARFRQAEIFGLEERLPDEEDEYEASQAGLSYVRLNGDIGNLVNGAGLAMATNDLVSLYGGKCANFLDVGGGATRQTLLKAFEILNRDTRIRGILINIYGGIVRCDMIAESIVAAAKQLKGFKVPVVIRLQGTNSDKGLELIAKSALDNVIVEPDFELAAEKIVNATKHSHQRG
ncbi:Uncharacterized protein PECH_001454 [Penicillium ucsense]|uniref:Succinate--CoA ligase [ADP-forming] subunit beta, mitochondrial n=1 Tax=Penicillium ucsense TaxID=2839758 RepID=A0A8J8W5Q8_9EURO|nr:Uncharacterized protein PECM_001094 [Penicillium ucsense]KAF7738226.1 Uncharacterized protein PECH_001454 [Penicillium ucsense]